MPEQTPDTSHELREERIAVEPWADIEAQKASGLMLIPEQAMASTLVRYEDDLLGAAMAIDVTHVLLPELPTDGALEDDEAGTIDRIVEILRNNQLAGATIEDIARVLDIDFELGALYGLQQIVAILSEERWESHDALEELRKELGLSELLEEEVDEEVRDALSKAAMDIIDSVGLLDDDEDIDDSEEQPPEETLVDDQSGEEFTIS